MESPRREELARPIGLTPREWSPSGHHPLPTRRGGEILPPGASRRGRWSNAASAIPAWIILGLIWWRAIVEQPDQLAVGALIWAGCAVFTLLVIVGWVAWNRALAHRRELRYGGRSGAPVGDIDYRTDALGRAVVTATGARSARHLKADVSGDVKKIGIVGN
jgi:hypothetical protein